MLEGVGFVLKRRGKGDHTIYSRGSQEESIDGSANHEMPKGRWYKLRKKYGLRG
jgi:hypothetical protein